MSNRTRSAVRPLLVLVLAMAAVPAVFALQAERKASRFDPLVINDPSLSLDVATQSVDDLPANDPARVRWQGFRGLYGSQWSIYLDRRSGAPMLVQGQGIPWISGSGNHLPAGAPPTVDSLERALRGFVSRNRALFLADDSELVLNRQASGPLTPDVWQITYDRQVGGIPVAGERFQFVIGHGNLILFGAPRWSSVDASPEPLVSEADGLQLLYHYMGVSSADKAEVFRNGELLYLPQRAPGAEGPYQGPMGGGYRAGLVRVYALRVDGEPGTWVGFVDARDGSIRALFDDNRYAQVKGGVYPVSDDQICPDGCEQQNYPMPYANITGGNPQTANSMGIFSCTPGGSTATTTLAGPYVKVADTCGAVSQSVTCDADLDLQSGPGTDCIVPTGASAGDTHSSRTSFYHLNRIAEHGRAWLPGNVWLTQQLTDNINLNATCNAFWDHTAVNFYKSGGGCNNTGEIAGVFLHEWGHGLDENDGGGFDNPSEAYADITAFMSTHVSCVGRGFFQSGQCSGYGDACLNCTGIRDQDWDKHASHTPATPQGFLTNNCGSGSGPCGKEVHCEGYVSAETIWDLAARDLPAAGLDQATAWQLTDRLWYKSRNGSGGNAYTCALPNSDGCAATTWFSKLRVIDDDDGNLANGTPHAAAIFSAFKRHNIACGAAGDASNQNSSTCPALGAPTLTGTAGSASATLNWTAVPNATSYYVLRNDAGCSAGSTIIATVAAPTTTYTDSGLANGFTQYYRVQAVGTNVACEGVLSACQTLTPQPFAGSIRVDGSVYNCSALVTVTVTDANIGASTTSVAISSSTETTPETITLTQTSPGSANYVGTITLTSAAPAPNGLLSVVNGDTITATYIDADDGQGGHNLTRQTTATTDCVAPAISGVASSNVTGQSARITWITNENATSTVSYGLTPPPGQSASVASKVTAHTVDLAGLAECSNYVYSVSSADAVGNVASDTNGGNYYAFTTGKNTQPNYTSTDGPVPIPDNNPTGASSFITVAESKTIQDVNVKVNLTHTYDGDITLYLVSPGGTQITLSARRGGSSDNYTNTVFDDQAATPISSGTAPFTGSFRPETPLSVLNGTSSAGTWRLWVVDSASIDVGTIDNWTLSLTYPAAACGPHASYRTNSLVADTCSTGGAGNGNAIWDAGESVQFKVNLDNDGSNPLTGVTATLTPTTPGVTMTTGTASYPTIAAGTNADSLAPHFTAHLPSSLACGSSVGFNVTINANEGTWTGSFTHVVGQVLSGNSTLLNETFAGGIPGTWTIVDGGSGGGAAATWTTANPGNRTITPPLTSPVAIVDSDNAGSGSTQDEQMITAAVSAVGATTVTLDFDQYFHWYSGGNNEIADVDVRSSATGGAWVNVLRQQGADSPNPDHKTLNITTQAVGAPDVQVRFHYYQATFEWWWQVDNVKVTTTGPAGCSMNTCVGGAPLPHPVPDGTFGSAMTAARGNPLATTINLNWDVVTCSSTNHHLLYGDLATVSSYSITGSSCSLGISGTASWSGVPSGSLWFVVVGDDGAGPEGSWGKNSAGAERGGSTPSNQCGDTIRNNGGTCP